MTLLFSPHIVSMCSETDTWGCCCLALSCCCVVLVSCTCNICKCYDIIQDKHQSSLSIILKFESCANRWKYGFHKNSKYRRVIYRHMHSCHTDHGARRWPVVMAAGTSAPTRAETSSPRSATLDVAVEFNRNREQLRCWRGNNRHRVLSARRTAQQPPPHMWAAASTAAVIYEKLYETLWNSMKLYETLCTCDGFLI